MQKRDQHPCGTYCESLNEVKTSMALLESPELTGQLAEYQTNVTDQRNKAEWVYGCAFCVTGHEDEIRRRIQEKTGLSVIAPARLCRFIKHGKESIIKKSIFPGYLFFEMDQSDDRIHILESVYGVIRILQYDNEHWVLRGDDAAIAKALFSTQGVIGFSKGSYVNGRLRIREGFLKGREDAIVKVNRRHRTAMVRIVLNQRVFELWVGFDTEDK